MKLDALEEAYHRSKDEKQMRYWDSVQLRYDSVHEPVGVASIRHVIFSSFHHYQVKVYASQRWFYVRTIRTLGSNCRSRNGSSHGRTHCSSNRHFSCRMLSLYLSLT